VLSNSLASYTETIDQDLTSVTNHDTVILPSDPISFLNHTTDLTIRNVSQDFWRAKGEWKQGSDGLRGLGNYSDSSGNKNMLISKFISNNNLTLSTLFKINNEVLNRKGTTSVSFVLSWINQTNFDMAGVAFRDDNVFVYFANVRNSKLTFYPEFPYSAPLFTGLKWNAGSLLNMTLSIKEETEDLYINGKKYLSRPIADRSAGYMGISTSGANDIIFTHLAIYSEDRHTHSYDKYYDYVSDGGNLIVFNTNGYGSVFDMLNRTINSIDCRSSPQYSNSVTCESNLPITKAKLGRGSINYVDVYQVLKDESISGKEKNSLLKNISGAILEKDPYPVHQNSRDIPMIFQNISAEGAIEVDTDFLAFQNGIDGRLVGLKTSNNPNLQSIEANITQLEPYGYSMASLNLNKVALLRSGGLYSHLTLGNQSMSVGFDPKASVRLSFPNGSQSNYKNVTSIVLDSTQSLEIITRTPAIKLDGIASFTNLHAARATGIDGENGIFSGRMFFIVPASDGYTLSGNVSISGTFETPPRNYDELSFLNSVSFGMYFIPPIAVVLLAIPFILAAIFLFYKRIF
jgi:hypothetical protein